MSCTKVYMSAKKQIGPQKDCKVKRAKAPGHVGPSNQDAPAAVLTETSEGEHSSGVVQKLILKELHRVNDRLHVVEEQMDCRQPKKVKKLSKLSKPMNTKQKASKIRSCGFTDSDSSSDSEPSLDRNILKNYRPVSNLSFISKLIEKVVAKQLNEFMSHEGLLNVNQSAYKSSHSTETALLKIQNDIALSVDSGKAVALTLLDLSAAFDMIDHSLLYDCLHDWFGLDGTVLSWIKSYLSNRKQKIKIGDSFSEAVILPFGVPQDSVLGPLLFTLYTSPLSQVISKFNVTHHLYADDTQIYLAVDSRNFDSSMEELTECLKSVQEWMDGVKLKLNPEKTEFIIIGQKAIRESLAPNFPVPLLQNNISPSVEVKNLGVIFDSDNSFDNHVAKVCRACYYHLRDLQRIRKFLGVETAILLANAMVSSRLDYCNSLLYGVSKSNIAKLQRVQNALCRIVFRLDKMSHVTPFLKKLHLLPIQHRILFKYNLLVFKAINLSQPPYLSALIRSSSLTRGNRLSISSTRPNKHIGRRGFAVAAPAEWNKLPQTVRSQQTIDGFRSQLKTYLFRLAYPPP